MNPLIGFVFLFLTIQNIFTIIEWPWYLEFVSDIEGGRTQMVRNGIFSYDFLKASIGGYLIFYLAALLSLYYLVLQRNGTIFQGFLLGATICAALGSGLFSMFSRTNMKHLPILLYDVFITGGVGFAASVYIWNNYKSFLSYYTPFFIGSFVITAILYCYIVYRIEMSPYKKKDKVE
jgi:hypothetical protein